MRQHQIIGMRGELLAMEALTAAGAMVSRPLDDAPYDLIAEYASRLFKVQVKTRDTDGIRVKYSIRHSDNGSGSNTRIYATDEVDIFCLVNLRRGIVTLRANNGKQQSVSVNYNKVTSSNVSETLEQLIAG